MHYREAAVAGTAIFMRHIKEWETESRVETTKTAATKSCWVLRQRGGDSLEWKLSSHTLSFPCTRDAAHP